MLRFFHRKSPEQQFWSWFLKHEDRLFNSRPMDDFWMANMSPRLQRIHKDLTWETGPAKSGKRELIISADGIIAAFSAVEALVDAAPPLDRWTIIRFRPREPDYAGLRINFGKVSLCADDIECRLHAHGSVIGIRLYIRGCKEPHEKPFVGAAFLLLDSALGEYDMECKAGPIEVLPFDHDPGPRIPFAQLRDEFDSAFERHCTAQA